MAAATLIALYLHGSEAYQQSKCAVAASAQAILADGSAAE